VTRRSILEYAQELRIRYFRSSKTAKGRMLDEFTEVTGLHRKAAIRLLHRTGKGQAGRRRGRPRQYGSEVIEALKTVWQATDRLCSRRLQPFIVEMVSILVRHSELRITADAERQLRHISASTIDRLLRPYRKPGGRKPLSTTRPGSLLKSCIPIRTFADWKEEQAGFMETDLVAHCGESAEGFYLNTLCAVDIASGWTECLPVWGKWQEKVRQSIHHMRTNLPFFLTRH
jgi:hypothetical protein